MFRTGAEIPGEFPNLGGDDEKARLIEFADFEEAVARECELEAIVAVWIKSED